MFLYIHSCDIILRSFISETKDTFSDQRFAFSCSYIIDGVVNSNSKFTNSSSVYPCEYKCTTAILVSSERTIFWILSTDLANLISSCANVDLPSTPSSNPINAFGTLNAANILFFRYSISSIPVNSIPLNVSISVPLCPPLTGR